MSVSTLHQSTTETTTTQHHAHKNGHLNGKAKGTGKINCTLPKALTIDFKVPGKIEKKAGSSRFSLSTLRRDTQAGIVTGVVAIPLSIGICLMSEYPIQTGLLTVAFACIISFISYLFRPGNYIGTPGVAAGLAPVLALGVHTYGMQNMAFVIFLTAISQAVIWKFNWQKYILKAVPHFLVEGLLAGVGLKIALKFLPYTYDIIHSAETAVFWNSARIQIVAISAITLLTFVVLYYKYKSKMPAIPYFFVIISSVLLAQYIAVPMLHVEHVPIEVTLPLPHFPADVAPIIYLKLFGFAMMLSAIDVIEQVMSNAAIEKIDPLGRKCDTNNSLLAIWIANLGSSFFGGMTNLDGLAKSATNAMAGAVTKFSNLVTAAVILFFLFNHQFLEFLPEFSLAVLMIFTGWKMMIGVLHTAHDGKYALMLSIVCGIMVYEAGIFEGLLVALAIHSIITYIIYKQDNIKTFTIVKEFLAHMSDDDKKDRPLPDLMEVEHDETTGNNRYISVRKSASDKKSLMDFINDWGSSVNSHNVLNIVGLYDYDALLWGTFAKELKPGHSEIKKYFVHLMELGDVKVNFDSREVRQYGDMFIQSGAYTFSYHKRNGELAHVPARYSFVCKKRLNSWFILEHHSSQFPD